MKRPNILIFVTDDHGAWANGCYGNSEVQSPTLDQLAAEGTRFAKAFTPIPVCSPARACLWTGRTPSQVGIHDYLSSVANADDWLADETTLFQYLHTAGYFCGLSGKWHIGDEKNAPRGLDWYVGLRHTKDSRFSEEERREHEAQTSQYGKRTGFLTDAALLFLDESPNEQPFFLSVGYTATHSPYANQEPELVSLYDDATFRDIPAFEPHPWFVGWNLVDGNTQREKLKTYYANHYAAVTDIDRNIGRILQHLKEQGKLDDTIVIYTADHGCSMGHQGIFAKGNSTRPFNMYEHSIHIPLIVRHPSSVKAGQVVENLVDHYDTFQTICEYAGVEPPASNYPGRSYIGLLRGEDINWGDTVYGEYGDLRMIRTPQWKLVRRYPDGPDDLFDLQNDPDEKNNSADNPEYSEVRAQLLKRLEEWYADYEDPQKSGLRVKLLPVHNPKEAWRDGVREERGLQVYGDSAAVEQYIL